MNVINIGSNAKKTFFLVLSALIGLSVAFCHAETQNKPAIYHAQYPDLFVSYTKQQAQTMPKEYWLNKKAIKPLEQTQIKPLVLPFNLMLLIEHSTLYSGKEAEGKKNHFLLELSTYLEQQPHTIVSFLVNDNITSFDFNKENILALEPSSSSQARISDALGLGSQQIRSKFNHQPFVILVIGSGKNIGNMQYSFMPSSPILYFSSESIPLTDPLLSFIIQASGGFSDTIPDLIDFSKMFEQLLDLKQDQWHHLVHISVPWHAYRPINLISLDKTPTASSNTFPSPVRIIFVFMLFSVLFLLFFFLILVKQIKKKKQHLEQNKNKHEFSTAFLNITHKEERFEVRISKCEFILGNANTCDCMIDDFDLSASHCMIREKNGVHEIIDLNSRNGVWVNGIKTQQQVLCDEDMISIGKTCILYRQGLINYVSDKKIL